MNQDADFKKSLDAKKAMMVEAKTMYDRTFMQVLVLDERLGIKRTDREIAAKVVEETLKALQIKFGISLEDAQDLLKWAQQL